VYWGQPAVRVTADAATSSRASALMRVSIGVTDFSARKTLICASNSSRIAGGKHR
jgi:hypothetical protein